VAQSAALQLDEGNPRLQMSSRRPSNSRMSSGEYRGSQLLGEVSAEWAENHPRAAAIFSEIRVRMDWLEEGDRPLLEQYSHAKAKRESVEELLTDAESLPLDDPFWKRQTYNQLRARVKDLTKEMHELLQMMNANGLYRQRREVAGGGSTDSQQLTLPNVEVA